MRPILVLTAGLLLTYVLQAEAQMAVSNTTPTMTTPTTTTTTPMTTTPTTTTPTTTTQNKCNMFINYGICPNAIMRWGFNVNSGTCIAFLFEGAQGNGNNFATQQECKAACC
uniref:Inter-alpha-trypsin inhibitor-like n=1 Tax=Geotrypetes seraphini TaxID=260995 RepID=A0A6P8SBU9_GEOSA|nr:inter-alpha-trypsin inhibitor-like [Geotrypetes seraphini]